MKAGAIFSDVFTVLKIGGHRRPGGVGLALGSSAARPTSRSRSPDAVPGGLGAGLAHGDGRRPLVHGGWQHATYASGEVKNPRRTLPLAMIIGTAAVTVIYLSVNVAYMFLLTPAEIAASPRVAADAVSARARPGRRQR